MTDSEIDPLHPESRDDEGASDLGAGSLVRGPSGASLPVDAKTWPSGVELSAEEVREASCLRCGTPWRIHRSMAGFRLRCSCGAWVDVPPELPTRGDVVDRHPAELPTPALATIPNEKGLLTLTVETGDTYEPLVPTSLPMAPGTLQSAAAVTRARWTNVGLLEIFGVLLAIALPQLFISWFSVGQEEMFLFPIASFVSSVAIFTIAFFSGSYGTIGLRRAPLLRWVEGVAMVPLAFGCAWAWIEILRVAFGDIPIDPFIREMEFQVGLGWTIFVIAVCPAIVEEIAFRGMLQGRMMALLGGKTGLVVVAMAFALVHFSPATLPIHLLGGLYLGWLRERSSSLLPGMLVHFLYNLSVILFLK